MTAVVDSGPLIALAAVGQVERPREQCGEILIVPAVEREVIDEGQGRAGEAELRVALAAGWARRVPAPDQILVARLRRPALAVADSDVLACAIANGRLLVVADDAPLRRLALEEQLPLVGTVGVLVLARLDDRLPALKPLLDQLVAAGFRLDPAGPSIATPSCASAKTHSSRSGIRGAAERHGHSARHHTDYRSPIRAVSCNRWPHRPGIARQRVAFDEQCPTWRFTSLGPPRREVAGAVVPLGRAVDAVRIWPHAEVPDV